MMPAKKGKSTYLLCQSCGARKKNPVHVFKLSSKIKAEKVKVVEKEEVELPITHRLCPKCGRERAYWWTQQNFDTEKSPISFFRCTKCTYTWREQ
jgi:DNA-directed RNA polymerase subunit M